MRSYQPGPIASIICHMIKIARPRRTIQPPKHRERQLSCAANPLALSDADGQSGVPESAGVLTTVNVIRMRNRNRRLINRALIAPPSSTSRDETRVSGLTTRVRSYEEAKK